MNEQAVEVVVAWDESDGKKERGLSEEEKGSLD